MARKSRKQSIMDSLNGIQPKQDVKPPYARAGVYVRVSVEDKNETNSISSQKQIAQDFLNYQPDIMLHKFYIDNGISSFATKRPAFLQMIEDANAQLIDCIIVKDLSRLGRNYIEALPYVEQIFPMQNIRFISILDYYDSKDLSANDMLILMMKSLINYSYSVDTSAKVKSAIGIKQEKGTYLPARLPYGYEKKTVEGITVVVLDNTTATTVREIFDMAYGSGSSYQIASELNRLLIPSPAKYRKMQSGAEIETDVQYIWSSDAVTRILKNRYYTGAFVGGKTENILLNGTKRNRKSKDEWIIVENHHEAIISVNVYDEIQKRFKPLPKQVFNFEEKEYWAENLFCGYCGKRMKKKKSWNRDKTEYSYRYICPQKDNTKGSCVNKSISSKKLKELILRKIIEEIEIAKVDREQALKYEQSLKYRLRCKEKEKQLIRMETEYRSLIVALKVTFEKFKEQKLYSAYDFMKIHEFLHDRNTCIKSQIEILKKQQDEYSRKYSSYSNRIQALAKYDGASELTEEMCRLMERCEFQKDSISILFVKSI